MTGRRPVRAVAAILSLLLLGGCSSNADVAEQSGPRGELVVFAAASLAGAFDEIAAGFTEENPQVRVTINFGASSTLAAGIVSGAPADVFAAASAVTMARVADAELTTDAPTVFVRNVLEIAVPPGNPARITGISDLADESRTIALCAPEVPCGAAAEEVFREAGIRGAPDTLEQDVRGALTKVELGEVDAALVYHSDVRAASGRIEGIPFPEAQSASVEYLIAPVADSGPAAAFVEFVLGDEAQRILQDAGFRT